MLSNANIKNLNVKSPKVLLVTSAGTAATGGGQSFSLSTRHHENALNLSQCVHYKIQLPTGLSIARKINTFASLVLGHLGGVNSSSISSFEKILDEIQPLAVFFDWTLFGPLAKIAKKSGCFVFTQSHNCEYDFYAGQAALRGGLAGELLRAAHRAESQSVESSDVLFTLSAYDRDRFRQIYGSQVDCRIVNPHVKSLAIRLQQLSKRSERTGPLTAVFLGSAGLQNRLACTLLANRWTGDIAQLKVIGSVGNFLQEKHKEVALAARGITVAGFVKSLDKELVEADAMVCPMHLGSGIKVKMIDALSNGCPVLTSPEALHGFEFAEKSGWVRGCSLGDMEKVVANLRSTDLSVQRLLNDTLLEAELQAQTLLSTYEAAGLAVP